MKTSTMLREAQQRIKSEWNTHICTALDSAFGFESRKIREEILRRIRPCYSETTWLKAQIGVDCNNYVWNCEHKDELREWRVRWLDLLIAEYEAKGD